MWIQGLRRSGRKSKVLLSGIMAKKFSTVEPTNDGEKSALKCVCAMLRSEFFFIYNRRITCSSTTPMPPSQSKLLRYDWLIHPGRILPVQRLYSLIYSWIADISTCRTSKVRDMQSEVLASGCMSSRTDLPSKTESWTLVLWKACEIAVYRWQ